MKDKAKHLKDLANLAKLDSFLRANPDWKGIELDPDAPIPDFLLAAKLPPIRAHIRPVQFQELLDGGHSVETTKSTQDPPKSHS